MSEPLLHWIDGESVASVAGTTRTGTDPSTGGPGTRLSLGTAAEVDRAVRAAHRARTSWRHLGSLERGRILAAVARRLLAELDALAAMETADTGKPLALSAAEIRGAAEYFEFYAALVNLPAGQVLDIQAADSALPFGGTKESGWGRETCRETLEEYLETKTVVVSL
jgi:aldehyde dehydrogenase (NAD+)